MPSVAENFLEMIVFETIRKKNLSIRKFQFVKKLKFAKHAAKFFELKIENSLMNVVKHTVESVEL